MDTEWESRLGQGGSATRKLLMQMGPLVAHACLLQFAEAYSVVFNLLAEHKDLSPPLKSRFACQRSAALAAAW